MHSIEELGTNVPAFLAKLWKIVEDVDTNDLIGWSPGGTSFYIRNQACFARELLPLYYKHNNMASFIRQLNMYGFHKVVSIEGGGLKVDKDEMEFAHQYFLMGHPYLLEHIKRKIPTSKIEEGRAASKPELINKVLADVKGMKGRQDSLDSQLSSMKRENEVLWREVAILRQKHMKQQQIVNKLIQFLVTMVQSSRNGGIGIKRHYPLMLNDTSHSVGKVSKLSAELSDLNSARSANSPTGPVIHELDASELLEGCEANTDGTEPVETFLPSDLCNVVIVGDEEHKISPSQDSSKSCEPASSNQNAEQLLELADECPLSPSMLLTASPIEVIPVAPRLSGGKNKARSRSVDGRKRRVKRTNSNKVPSNSAPKLSLKVLTDDSDKDPLINGVELLDAVLPTLVEERTDPLLDVQGQSETDDMQVDESLLASDTLESANNAAVAAITNVVAAKKKKPPKSQNVAVKNQTSALLDKTVIDNGVIPDINSDDTKSTITNSVAFAQQPSTSNDKSADESNMLLAYTGNTNSDDKLFNRDEFGNHVDTMQSDLEMLKDLLKGEGYSLDANTLLGVCAAIPAFNQDFLKLFNDDSLADVSEAELANLPERDKNEEAGSQLAGNELATYSSNLLDMVDLFGSPGENEWDSSAPETGSIMDVSLSELNTPHMSVASPSEVSRKKM